MFCDIFTSCKSLNQTAVEFSAGSVIDVCNVGIGLVKSGAFDETLQAVALSVVILNIDQETEAVFKREFLHFGIVHLCDEGI